MVDEPWRGRTLSRGQVEQRLRTFGCIEIEAGERFALWEFPGNGRRFTVSYDECDAEFLDGVLSELQSWLSQDC